jgi:hypothetical protein
MIQVIIIVVCQLKLLYNSDCEVDILSVYLMLNLYLNKVI